MCHRFEEKTNKNTAKIIIFTHYKIDHFINILLYVCEETGGDLLLTLIYMHYILYIVNDKLSF